MKPLRRLVSEPFDAELGISFEFLQKRGSQLHVHTETPQDTDDIIISVDTKYSRGPGAFVLVDPTSTSAVRVITTEYSKQLYLQGHPVTEPLIITPTNMTYYSEETSSIFMLDFETEALTYVAYATSPPTVSQETFLCNGILVSSNHILPISAMLGTDDSLADTTCLQDFKYEYQYLAHQVYEQAHPEVASLLRNYQTFVVDQTHKNFANAGEVSAILDRAGASLFLSTAKATKSVLGFIVALDKYYAAGGTFSSSAQALVLPSSSRINAKDATVHVVSDQVGFILTVSDARNSEAYLVANNNDAGMDSHNLKHKLVPIPLGYREWTQHASATEQYLISPGIGKECLILKSSQVGAGVPHTFSTTVIVESEDDTDGLTNIYFGTSECLAVSINKIEQHMNIDTALSLILHGQPADEAMRYHNQVLREHIFPETAVTTSAERHINGLASHEVAMLTGTPKRLSSYTALVQSGGQQTSLADVAFQPFVVTDFLDNCAQKAAPRRSAR